jgi:O-antigen ligase
MFIVTLVSPMYGLLAVAFLAPLGHLLAVLMGQEAFRLSEAFVLAFLTAWVLRPHACRSGPRVPAAVGSLLAATIVASIATQTWLLRQYPGELTRTFEILLRDYYRVGGRPALVEGARLLEGLALMTATVIQFRQRPALAVKLPAALAASATVAGLASVLLWRGIGPTAVLAQHAKIGYRVSAHVADVNAAGSYFVLSLCAALGMAARAHGRTRTAWSAAVIACAVGLWLAGSRSAIGAAAIVLLLAVAWLLTVRWPPTTRFAVLSGLLVLSLAAGTARTRQVERDPTFRGRGFRQQFNATSLRMIGARPLFGLGVGQYYDTSPLFLSPQLSWTYGHENAHNYFLQLAAELGSLGFAVFAAWIGLNSAVVGHALARAPRDMRLLGAAAGIIALIGTSATGHPLLVNEVAFPFWMLFGLTVALAGSTLMTSSRQLDAPRTARERIGWPLTAAVGIVLSLAAVMSARSGPISPPSSPAVTGFYEWETDSDGRRFRWTSAYASLFVPANVKRIRVPVRLPIVHRPIAPMGVEAAVGGMVQSRSLVREQWSTIEIVLPHVEPPARFTRVDLRVDQVWQPALYVAGSADMRSVGVQVGEYELQ